MGVLERRLGLRSPKEQRTDEVRRSSHRASERCSDRARMMGTGCVGWVLNKWTESGAGPLVVNHTEEQQPMGPPRPRGNSEQWKAVGRRRVKKVFSRWVGEVGL